MKRLFLFLGSLPWGSRLQILAVTVILGWYAWFDFERGNSFVTIGIILVAWLIGWLLMPVMIAHQRLTFRIWTSFGVAFFATLVLARNQWWWHLMIAHYGRELIMWLDFSCGYWFISEVRLQQQRESMTSQDDGANRNVYSDRPDAPRDDFGNGRAF